RRTHGPCVDLGPPAARALHARPADAVGRDRVAPACACRLRHARGRQHRDYRPVARTHSQSAARHPARGARQQLREGAVVLRNVDARGADRTVGRERHGRGADGGTMDVVTAPAATAVDVSVIVCTRNRSDALARLLERLEQLVVPAGVRWELIVVDNGSTDGTAALLASPPRTLPMRVVNELTCGLSRARNAGLAAATGDLLLMTDDDCLPDPQWLAVMRDEFARAPSLGVLGGRVELFDQRDQPTTTRTSRERGQIAGAL